MKRILLLLFASLLITSSALAVQTQHSLPVKSQKIIQAVTQLSHNSQTKVLTPLPTKIKKVLRHYDYLTFGLILMLIGLVMVIIPETVKDFLGYVIMGAGVVFIIMYFFFQG